MSFFSPSSEPQLDHTDQTKLKLRFLYDIKNCKIVFAETSVPFFDILFGFLGFPISSLAKLEAGAIPQIFKRLASLGGDTIQPGFNNSKFFELKPTFEGWHNRVLTLLNGESPSSSAGDDFKNIPLLLCPTSTFDIGLIPYSATTYPTTLCGTYRKPMHLEVPYVDHARNGNGGWIHLQFIIFGDMKMMSEGDYLDTFDLVKSLGFNWGNLRKKEFPQLGNDSFTAQILCGEKDFPDRVISGRADEG